MKKCPKCGKTYDDSWGICIKCTDQLIDFGLNEEEEKAAIKRQLEEKAKETATRKKQQIDRFLNYAPIKYVASLGWTKEDAKKAILLAAFLLGLLIVLMIFKSPPPHRTPIF